MSHKILVQKFSDENICARVINQEWDDAFSLIYVPLFSFLLQIIDIVIITMKFWSALYFIYKCKYKLLTTSNK